MTQPPYITLNDGHALPQLGLGFWRTPAQEAARITQFALQSGYRAFDTASIYGNEEGVGEGLRNASLPRQSLFVTTKLWIAHMGYDAARAAFDRSCQRLGLDTLDLYLIHWPQGPIVETWKAMAALQAEGRIKSIGVSNFTQSHLERIIGETGVVPAINQVELHPLFQQTALRRFHADHAIATQSWAPIAQGRVLNHPVVKDLAASYRKTPAQIVLRWHLECGLIAIPKSVTPLRIAENIEVFDFHFSPQDRQTLDALDNPAGRIGPDPAEPYPFAIGARE